MNSTTAFPRPDRDPARTVAGKWTVLARLPDVAEHAPTRSQSSRLLANADVHDYRFDPPQARSLYHPHDSDHTPQTSRRQSPILPHSNPFAIRGASTMETLGPIVRVVLLIALFTAAGVILLAGGNDPQPAVQQKADTQSTVTRKSLEPVDAVAEASTSATTVTGPASILETSANHAVAQAAEAASLDGPTDQPATHDARADGDATATTGHPYPETGWPASAMPEAGQSALPQVQTTDPPQAVAQLPGFITEIPQRHASHDDNEPGLH